MTPLFLALATYFLSYFVLVLLTPADRRAPIGLVRFLFAGILMRLVLAGLVFAAAMVLR